MKRTLRSTYLKVLYVLLTLVSLAMAAGAPDGWGTGAGG